MPRYYDIDKLAEMAQAKADTLIEGKEAFLYVSKWLELLPAADVVPKSELEKLQVECLALKQKRLNLFERLDLIENARTKAITEFAERLKPKVDCEYGNKFYRDKCFEEIDNLVKEMTEGEQ